MTLRILDVKLQHAVSIQEVSMTKATTGFESNRFAVRALWNAPGPLLVALILSITSIARGQAPAAPPPITRPGSIADSGPLGYWTEMTPQGRAGGVLLGKVLVQSENPLWAPITVLVTCNGVLQHATSTDRKGNFLITTTKVRGALSLQSDAKRQMETFFEGCSVRASLAGFDSSEILITDRNLRDDPELGTLTLKRVQNARGTALSDTTGTAPANALKSFLKARSDLLDQQPDRAQRALQKSVEIYPAFAEAWYQLGKLQLLSNRVDAQNSFSKAVADDPHFIPPYEQLAGLAIQEERWSDVLANTNQALQLDPEGTPQIWFYNALANFQLGKPRAAEASASKSLAIDPSHVVPNTEQLLAVILAEERDYAGAIRHLRNCLTYLPIGPASNLVSQQIAQLEQLAGAQK